MGEQLALAQEVNVAYTHTHTLRLREQRTPRM